MTDKAREVEPCPFCGKQAEIERDSDHHGSWFNLGCSDHWGKRDDGKGCIAGRMFYTESERTEEECVALWNNRATITTLQGHLMANRERVAQWMLNHSYATGHGDDVADLLAELTWQHKEREDRFEALKAENERLREALTEIDKRPYYTPPVPRTQIDGLIARYHDCLDIARDTLRATP